jgi:DNA-binding LytR/AlgR family response regulator
MQKQSNILIVEDEMLIAYSIQKMVQKHFNCIAVVKNYDEALKVLENQPVDLALLDITLNNSKSGIDIAKQINKNYKIPFIYLTASTDEATVTKVIQTTPTAYISKPVQETNVITAIKLALANTSSNNIVLTIGKKEYHIDINQFIFAESEGVYITMHFTKSKPILLRTTFAQLQKQLPNSNFKRINKSEAINPNYITKKDTKWVFLNIRSFKISKTYWNI